MSQLALLVVVLRIYSAFAAQGNLTFHDPFQNSILAKNLDDLANNGNLIMNQSDFHPINSSAGFFEANQDLFGGNRNFFGSSSLKGGMNDKLDESIQSMMKTFGSQIKGLNKNDMFKSNLSMQMLVKRDKNSGKSPRGEADDIWTNIEGGNRNRFDERYRYIRHVEFHKFSNKLGLVLSRLDSEQEVQAMTKKVVSLMGNGYYFIVFNCSKPMFINAENKVETIASKAALDVLKKDDSCHTAKSGSSQTGDDIWHYKAETPADFTTYDFKSQAISEQILPFTKLLDVFSKVGLCDEFLRFMNHPAYFFDDDRYAKPKICLEPGSKSKENSMKGIRKKSGSGSH